LFSRCLFRLSALIFAIVIESIFVISVSGTHLHCNDVGDTTCFSTIGIVVNVFVFIFRVSEFVACDVLPFSSSQAFPSQMAVCFLCKLSRQKEVPQFFVERNSVLSGTSYSCLLISVGLYRSV
jgi:hypothetical protein